VVWGTRLRVERKGLRIKELKFRTLDLVRVSSLGFRSLCLELRV
jgi:hypothetical protein